MATITAGPKNLLEKKSLIRLTYEPSSAPIVVEKIVHVIREVPVEIIKEIEKIVEIKIPVYVDKLVTIEKIVEVVKEVPTVIEKFIEIPIEKLITKEVEIEKQIKFIPKWVWVIIALEPLIILGLMSLK